MRRPSPFTERRDPVDIKMTPMIDVVFLLMIYFIWTSSFGAAEQLLPSQISAESGGGAGTTANETPDPREDFENLVIRIVGTPGRISWTFNDIPMGSFAELLAKLAQMARIKRDAPVVLHPDPDVPLEHVIDVFDASRLVGFEKVQFAVNAP